MTRTISLVPRKTSPRKIWADSPPPMTAIGFPTQTVRPKAAIVVDARVPEVAFRPVEISIADGPAVHVMYVTHVLADGTEKAIDGDTIVAPGESVSAQVTNVGDEPATFYATLWGYRVDDGGAELR